MRECALQIYSYMQHIPCEDLPDMINRLEFNTPFKNELVSAMRKKHEEFVEWLVMEAEWVEVMSSSPMSSKTRLCARASLALNLPGGPLWK